MAVVEALLAGTLARLGKAARLRMSRLEGDAGADKVLGGGATPSLLRERRKPRR
jgi:hypothetical protein